MADIGNSRMKWACLDELGRFRRSVNLSLDDQREWFEAWAREARDPASCWAIASVNPPVTMRFLAFLKERGVTDTSLFDSAAAVCGSAGADVVGSVGKESRNSVAHETSLSHRLAAPSQTGADRALAVLAATSMLGRKDPGLVISCGTAITIERIAIDGVWEGGAIAAGLPLVARALHQSTAQLPWIPTRETVPPWGDSTAPAIAAGVFWGVVGTVRELIARQGQPRWQCWTGGDAELLARFVEPQDASRTLIPDLVLRGLALAAFRSAAEEVRP
jgi:type III pantothenate kinase